ncbi:MAG TPA: VOC family protein [Steroidobacteraceae bacterium]|nr:VOC family protein [Steroidobacteraceae bacterium]
MSQLEPYLFFDGNCAEAMRFYEKALGGKLEMMMKASEAPAQEGCPGANPDAVMHACVTIEGRHLMASDWMAPDPYPGIKGVSISLTYPSVEEAERKFKALSAGGKVNMPLEKTFWVESFGMLTDKYGANWMISGGKPAM